MQRIADLFVSSPAPQYEAITMSPRVDDKAGAPESPLMVTPKASISRRAFFFWVAVNCISTLAIVFANKRILTNPTLRGAPTLFVAYHFFLTSVTLHIASSAFVGSFERKPVPLLSLLPLCVVFAAHTVVTNWSLALLDVAIYQELRILVTPATVIINFVAYQRGISLQSIIALAVVCSGIAITIQSETVKVIATSGDAGGLLKNGPIGYACGLGGVSLSALYTVWLAVDLPKLQVSSMQLLHKQAPMGCLLLLLLVPFLDTIPIWGNIRTDEWILLGISGLAAVLINMSQFFIIAGSSAVSSTVVGHLKTCMIVAIGWSTATKAIPIQSGLGILLAIAGIAAYSTLGLLSK